MRLLSSLWLLIALLACGQNSSQDSSKILGWGHLSDLDRSIDSSRYFFGLDKDIRLHVCFEGRVPRSLDLSWLKAEVFTAVNIWAQAIGRYIPIEFDSCQNKPSMRVIFAPIPESGSFVAYTRFELDRVVYLNPAYDWLDTGEILGFNKQAELNALPWQDKARFLFPLISDGVYSSFKLQKKPGSQQYPQASLAIIMHELGHAWGLCDLYLQTNSDPGFNENCSKKFRNEPIGPNEIMNANTNPGTAKFSLGADDRKGLQSLIQRQALPVSRTWPKSASPIQSATLLDLSLGQVQTETAAGILLTGPSRYKASRGQDALTLKFEIRAPLDTSGIFLYEKEGLGPFANLSADQAVRTGSELIWKVDLVLSLDDGRSSPIDLNYIASGAAIQSSALPLRIDY